jgi:hypothetical protein
MRLRPNLSNGVFAIALAALGCSSNHEAAPADGGSARDAPQEATPTYATSPCGECVAQQCGTEISGCSGDPDCAAYLTCLDGCGLDRSGNVSSACEAACPRGASTSGTQAEMQLTQCRTSGPGAACAGCGVDAGGGPPLLHQMCMPSTDSNACHQCEKSTCCKSYAQCFGDPECSSYITCVGECYNAKPEDAGVPDAEPPPDGAALPCDEYCLQAHPNGLTGAAPLFTCDIVNCAAPCGAQTTACEACAQTQCATEYANFYGTADGWLISDCQIPCSDTSCLMACENAYPAGKMAADLFDTCFAAKCTAACK